MKKLMVTLLFLAAMSSFAMAQDFIGIFTDEVGTACDAEFDTPFTDLTVYVMAYIPSFPDGITAAEFSIPNIPEDMGYPCGDTDITWATPLVIGDVAFNISLAFDAPLYGPFALLGTIEFGMYEQDGCDWIGIDQTMNVLPGVDEGNLVIVDDAYNIHTVMGGIFTFNCTDVCFCLDGTATEDVSWSAVKALF